MVQSVLIVDDDRELRTIYRTILERAGFTVYEAGNGADALKFLVNQTPDALVIDMLMPLLSGAAVIQRVRQMPALNKMKLIVLTAYPRFRESAQQYEADQFLVKPIKPDDLINAIRAAAPDPAVDETEWRDPEA